MKDDKTLSEIAQEFIEKRRLCQMGLNDSLTALLTKEIVKERQRCANLVIEIGKSASGGYNSVAWSMHTEILKG